MASPAMRVKALGNTLLELAKAGNTAEASRLLDAGAPVDWKSDADVSAGTGDMLPPRCRGHRAQQNQHVAILSPVARLCHGPRWKTCGAAREAAPTGAKACRAGSCRSASGRSRPSHAATGRLRSLRACGAAGWQHGTDEGGSRWPQGHGCATAGQWRLLGRYGPRESGSEDAASGAGHTRVQHAGRELRLAIGTVAWQAGGRRSASGRRRPSQAVREPVIVEGL